MLVNEYYYIIFHKGQVLQNQSPLPHLKNNALRSGCSESDSPLTISSTSPHTQLTIGICTCNEYDIGGTVRHDMTVLCSNFIVKIKWLLIL